jgi:hypothetical protein
MKQVARSKLIKSWHNLCILFQGLFPPGQGATIGVDFMIKTVEVEGDRVKVCTCCNLWLKKKVKFVTVST